MAEETKYLTQTWYNKLVNELNDLKNNKLPEVLERLREAIKQWDISENTEYDDAMSQKDLIELRINEIENMLKNVEIIQEWQWDGKVWYWSRVKLEDDKRNVYEFTIVGTWEVDIFENSISFDSPVWTAIKWKKIWDVVNVKSPRRKYEMKIVDVN